MDSRKPDVEQIVEMLQLLKISPGERFHQRMATAPWIRNKSTPPFTRRWRLAIGSAALLVVLLAVLVIPSVQVAAKQFIRLFWLSQRDERIFNIILTSGSSIQQINSPDYCSLTVEQAEEKVGYPLSIVHRLPVGFNLIGTHVDPMLQSVTLCYFAKVNHILFTQRKLGKIQEFSSIGASAQVEKVWVRGVEGEYVKGGWRTDKGEVEVHATETPGTQVTLAIYWDASLPQQMLRWIEGETQFEIIYQGDSGFSQSDLLDLAESVQNK